MEFIGVSPSAQVTRSNLRVVLGGGFSLDDILKMLNDSFTWPAAIEDWRARVADSNFIVPAQVSLAAIKQSGLPDSESRAVVDVFILGAESGVSYGDVANRMDRLVALVDVLSIQIIGTITDSTGRGAVLDDAIAHAAEETLAARIERFLRKSALVLGLALAVVVAVVLVRKRG